MSMDQKIMDKFVEQTQEILVLKDLNRKLKIENDRCKEIAERDGKDYSDVVRKLKIAVDALRFYADADNWNHIEAGTHYVTNVYPCVDKTDYGDGDFIISERMNVDDCGVGGKKARQAIKEIEGSIEKE